MAGETFYGEKWKLPYTAQQLEDVVTNQVPRIGVSGNWEVWSISTSAWVDTGVAADPQTAKIDADDIAPVETASTASQAYAVNSFLVCNGQLYRVTAAIAQGDTLTVGTNIAAADVGNYLSMLLNAGIDAANLLTVADANTAPNGFSKTDTNTLHPYMPSSTYDVLFTSCFIDGNNERSGFQLGYHGGFVGIRTCQNDVWRAWGDLYSVWDASSPFYERPSANFLGSDQIYEKNVGRVYINAANTNFTIAHGISNLGAVLSVEGLIGNSAPYTPLVGNPNITGISVDATNVTVTSKAALNQWVGVFLRYTKTA